MFLPDNIDLAHSEKYNLSIRLTPSGFSFCIYSPSDSSIFSYQDTSISKDIPYIDSLKKLIFDFGFFSQIFNETSVTIVDSQFTIIPKEYWNEHKANSISNFCFHSPKKIMLFDESPKNDLITLFGIDEEVYSFLLRHLNNPVFRHYSTYLMNLYNGYADKADINTLFIDFNSDYLSLMCYYKHDIASCNAIRNSSDTNSIYHIFNVWNEHGLDQENDKIFISGFHNHHITIIKELEKLIRNVELIELLPKVQPIDDIKNIPTDILTRV